MEKINIDYKWQAEVFQRKKAWHSCLRKHMLCIDACRTFYNHFPSSFHATNILASQSTRRKPRPPRHEMCPWCEPHCSWYLLNTWYQTWTKSNLLLRSMHPLASGWTSPLYNRWSVQGTSKNDFGISLPPIVPKEMVAMIFCALLGSADARYKI